MQNNTLNIAHLYETHRQYVRSVCLGIVHNPDDADDLTQEVFMTVCRKIGQFEGRSAFRTWLHKLAVSHCLMAVRRRDHHRPQYVSLEGVELVHHPRPESELVLAQVSRGLTAADRQLLADYLDGHTPAELAARDGRNYNTVRSDLHRLRAKLRTAAQPQTASK